jgi:hypothetical protein
LSGRVFCLGPRGFCGRDLQPHPPNWPPGMPRNAIAYAAPGGSQTNPIPAVFLCPGGRRGIVNGTLAAAEIYAEEIAHGCGWLHSDPFYGDKPWDVPIK